ncbi:hypothetical protein PsalN5692_03572 (plasmid) [Piscirickettsia salmonis]|uniref:hypothetical protein n=1 Tax=Piscirickettsia salmonis TaxID=1238 RepID=UPI0012B9A41E|nr:hypothetical protein [Piscirickettsia salmonis]QGP52064.1 hypothetical protein PsalN5692_03572 [Piscirickettsia salmonis]
MPMPALNEIKKQYLISLAGACADPEDSVLYRSSIQDKAGNSSGFKVIEAFFLGEIGNKIEKAFQDLKESLSRCNDSQEKSLLLDSFNSLFEKETEYRLDTARILAFFQDENLPVQTLHDMLLLEAINFKASSNLKEHFLPAIFEAMDCAANDNDENAFKVLDQNFKDIAKSLLDKLDLSCHPDLFKQLIDLDLGNQSDYIQIILNQPQQFQTLNYGLRVIKTDLFTEISTDNVQTLGIMASLFSCLWPKKESFETHFNLYEANVLKSFYDFSLPEGQNQDVLKSQLTQHEVQFLTASGLSDSDPECRDLSQRLLNSLGIQDSQPSPSLPLLFSQQQVAATGSTALREPTP